MPGTQLETEVEEMETSTSRRRIRHRKSEDDAVVGAACHVIGCRAGKEQVADRAGRIVAPTGEGMFDFEVVPVNVDAEGHAQVVGASAVDRAVQGRADDSTTARARPHSSGFCDRRILYRAAGRSESRCSTVATK
jgi:hypothetical protein